MDKPLGSNYSTIPTIHDIASVAEQRYRPPMLRRVSQSDPHLDEKNTPHIVSSTFDNKGGNNVNALMPLDQQTKSTSAVPTSVDYSHQPDIGRNISALNLGLLHTGENNSNIGPLRKASSFIHGTSFGLGKRQPSSPSLLHLQPSFCIGGGFTPVSTSVTTSVAEPTHSHHGGISMTVQPANTTVATLKSNEMQHSASIGGLFSSSSSDSSTSNRGIVSNNSSESLNTNTHKPLGIFGRGFFAKPMRSEEENYRYIMALDR